MQPIASNPSNNGKVSLECVNELKAGNKAAFREVFDVYYQRLALFAKKCLQADSFAKDIAQDTLTKAWKYRERFNSPADLEGFLFVTTRNACINYVRSRRNSRLRERAWADLWFNKGSDFDLQQLYTELVHQLEDRLNEIRGGKVVLLSLLKGKSTEEIAQELNTTVENVYVIKSRVLDKLRREFPDDFITLFLLVIFTGFGQNL